MSKQFVLIFSLIMLMHPGAWAQTTSARVKFNKEASTVAGIIPDGAEADYVSASTVAATAERPARNMVKVSIRKLPPGAKTNLRVGDEVWVFHGPDVMSFRTSSGQEITDVENTLFKGRATAPVGGKAVKPLLPPTPPAKAIQAQPPLPAPTTARKETTPSDSGRVSATTVDPNLARSTDKKKTEADVCITGRCLAANASKQTAEEKEALTELDSVAKKINLQHLSKAQAAWESDPAIRSYSHSPKTQAMIDFAMKRKHKTTTRYCWRYVKNAAEATSMIDPRPPTRYAKSGVTDLKAQGWTNLMENPKYKSLILSEEDAPKGAILIYKHSTSRGHPGHAEIKTGRDPKGKYEDGYVSDFYRPLNSSLKQRTLIGVMIKENP